MDQFTLHRWHAKRAGGRITLTGYLADDTFKKVVGIDVIEGILSLVRAVHKSGQVYHLVDL